VKEITSPEILILNNGLKIRLLGIKERPEKKKRLFNAHGKCAQKM
jgi:hypothetical protein